MAGTKDRIGPHPREDTVTEEEARDGYRDSYKEVPHAEIGAMIVNGISIMSFMEKHGYAFEGVEPLVSDEGSSAGMPFFVARPELDHPEDHAQVWDAVAEEARRAAEDCRADAELHKWKRKGVS